MVSILTTCTCEWPPPTSTRSFLKGVAWFMIDSIFRRYRVFVCDWRIPGHQSPSDGLLFLLYDPAFYYMTGDREATEYT